MIYLASVYSLNADKELMQKRFEYVEKYVATSEEHLYSPIVYSHAFGLKYELPKEYKFWKQRDRNSLQRCDALYVLMMPGWEDSIGVTDEIAYAKSINKPIKMIVCEDYHE